MAHKSYLIGLKSPLLPEIFGICLTQYAKDNFTRDEIQPTLIYFQLMQGEIEHQKIREKLEKHRKLEF